MSVPVILFPRDIADSVPRVYLHTTLALLREHVACDRAYRAVQRALPGGWGDDDPIPLARAFDVPGLALPNDLMWALRAVAPEQAAQRDRYARLLAASIAEAVLPIWERDYPGDERPRQAINAARRYADGEATDEELAAARAAAAAAARVAGRATAAAAARAAARAADAAAARAADADAAAARAADADAARAADAAAARAADAAAAADTDAITEVLRLTILREPVEEGGSCPPSHHVDDTASALG